MLFCLYFCNKWCFFLNVIVFLFDMWMISIFIIYDGSWHCFHFHSIKPLRIIETIFSIINIGVFVFEGLWFWYTIPLFFFYVIVALEIFSINTNIIARFGLTKNISNKANWYFNSNAPPNVMPIFFKYLYYVVHISNAKAISKTLT